MTADDRVIRTKALTELAIATREKVERQTLDLYLEDTAAVPQWAFVEACRRQRREVAWFPKVKELLEACDLVRREAALREEMRRPRRIAPPPIDPARHAELLANLKAAMKGHRMPPVNVSSEDDDQ